MSSSLSLSAEENRRIASDVRWIVGSGAPVNGVTGTGAGIAGPCSLYFDVTNKATYQNTGTQASPIWVSILAALGANSVGTTQLQDGSVTTAKIVDANITTAKIAANAVGAAQLANGAVGSTQLANASVGNTQLAANAVNTANIIAGAVTATQMALNSVDSPNLINNIVTFSKLNSSVFVQTQVTINTADFTGTSAGQFGNVNGYQIVAPQGVNAGIDFVSAYLSFTRTGAAFGGGGNITVNIPGVQIISATAPNTIFTGATNTANTLGRLASQWIPIVGNTALNLATTAPFTNSGGSTCSLVVSTIWRLVVTP